MLQTQWKYVLPAALIALDTVVDLAEQLQAVATGPEIDRLDLALDAARAVDRSDYDAIQAATLQFGAAVESIISEQRSDADADTRLAAIVIANHDGKPVWNARGSPRPDSTRPPTSRRSTK